jgi:WD40 repeat protein
VTFAVLAVLAFLQWRQADRRGQIALARQLAAQVDLLKDQPEMQSRLSLRLALATEAMRRLHKVEAQSLEVDTTLRNELAASPRFIGHFPVEVKGYVGEVQLSSDGRFVTAGSFSEGNVSIWEVATAKERLRIETAVRELTATRPGQDQVRIQTAGLGGNSEIKALSPEGTYLVTVNGDGHTDIVQVWEIARGRELLRLDLQGNNLYALSDDGRYLAVSTSTYDEATRTYSVPITRVWDVRERKEIPGKATGSIQGFSQDAIFVATSQGIWEVAGGLKARLAWTTEATGIAISSMSRYAAVSTAEDEEGEVDVWSLATGQKVANFPMITGFPLALTPDGKLVILYSVGIDGDDEIATIGGIVSRTGMLGRTAAITPSGQKLIATVSVDGKATDVWELPPAGGAAFTVDLGGRLTGLGITPEGRITAIVQDGEKLSSRTWDVESGQEKQALAIGLAGTKVAFAPDGVSFAVAGEDGLEVRKVGVPQPLARLAYAGSTQIAWSPDGRYLAAATGKDARAWDLDSRKLIGQLTLPGIPTALALSEGGGSIAAVVASGKETRAGQIHTAKLWNISNGAELRSFEPDKGQSIRDDTHCALDARNLVTRDLAIFEMKSGTLFSRLGLSEEDVAECFLSTDGQYLATFSLPGGIWVVRLWKLESRREAFRIQTGDRLLAFDQDSRYLVTAVENTVRVWSLRQDDLIAEACRRLPRNLSQEEWSQYVEGEPYHKTCPELP